MSDGDQITESARWLVDQLAISRNRISPIGYNVRSVTLSDVVTPTATFPSAEIISGTRRQFKVSAVLIGASLQVAISGNSAPSNLYIAGMINPPSSGGVSVGQNTDELVGIPYNLTTDQIIKEQQVFSAYGGKKVYPDLSYGVVASGDGTASMFFRFTLFYINDMGEAIKDNRR